MKYKKIISSLSLATAFLATATFNQEVQANEKPVDGKEKAVAQSSSEKRLQKRKRKLQKRKHL